MHPTSEDLGQDHLARILHQRQDIPRSRGPGQPGGHLYYLTSIVLLVTLAHANLQPTHLDSDGIPSQTWYITFFIVVSLWMKLDFFSRII